MGGGIYLLDSMVDIESSTINSNQANGTTLGEGGGIFSDGSPFTMGSTTVKKNQASTSGSDITIT